MSNTIDERIVEMQFNNGEFEKGIQESLKSLEALKKGLELDKSAKSLDSLSKVVSNVDFSAMAKGIETISSRFTTMGMVGMRVIQNITDKVLGMSERMIKSVTVDQITAGFSKYAQKTEAVQTIMSATGKTVEEVEEVLSRLNDYTDWTSFNFAEMTTTIGKFTSSGVDLEKAERAMEGIGNEASLAGATIQNANHAMYNFAQALATGKVQLMDWKSIENANMATKQFKEEIINTAIELGTLKKVEDGVGKTTKGTQVDFAKFNATLSEGWFTSDVLIKTLEKYADTSTELGQKAFDAAKKAITFGQAIDSVKDAVSTGWMNTFQLIFGNFEEASELWTGFADGLIEVLDVFSSARNELLSGWRDLNGEDGRQILLDGLVEIYQVLSDIFTMVGNVVREFFPPITSEHLMAISKGVKEFADNLHEAVHLTKILTDGGSSLFSAGGPEINLKGNIVEKLEELHGLLKNGSTGDEVKKLQERLISLGYLDKKGADGIFGPKTQAALKKFQEAAGIAVDGIYGEKSHEALGKALGKGAEEASEPLEKVENYVYHLTEGLTTLQRIARGFFAVVHIGANIGGFIINVVKSVINLLKPLGNVILTIAAVIGDCLVGFDKWITQSGFFQSALKGVQAFLEPVGKWISKVSDSIVKFLTTGPKIQSFTDLWNRLKDGLMGTEFGKKLSDAFARLQKTRFFTAFSKWLSGIKTGFAEFVNKIKEFFTGTSKGSKSVSGFAKVLEFFRKIVSKIGDALLSLPEKIFEIGSSVYEFVSGIVEAAKESPIVSSFIGKIGSFFSSIKSGAASFFENVPSYLERARAFFGQFIPDDFDFKAKGKELFGNVKNFFSGLYERLNSSGALSAVWERTKTLFTNIWEGLKEFGSLIVDVIAEFFAPKVAKAEGEEGIGGEVLEDVADNLTAFQKLCIWIMEKVNGLKESFSSIFDFLAAPFSGISSNPEGMEVAMGIVSKVGEFLKNLFGELEKYTPFDFVHLFEGIAAIFAIRGITKLFKAVTGFAKGVTSTFSKMGGVFTELKKFIKTREKPMQSKALSFLEIAGAIALIAGAIYVLGKLDVNELRQGGIALAVVGASLLAFVILAGKFGGGEKTLAGLGRTLLSLSGALAILIGVIWLLSKIKTSVLLNGLLKLGVVFIALQLFMRSLAKISSKYGAQSVKFAGLAGVVGALTVLSLLAWMLGKMDMKKFLSGVLKLEVIMFALRGFVKSLSKISSKYGKVGVGGFQLFGIVAALGLMALMTKLVSKIKPGVLYKGLLRIFVISKVLSSIVKSLTKAGGGKNFKSLGLNALTMGTMLAVLYGMAELTKVIGQIDTGTAVKGVAIMAAFSLILKALAGVASIFSKLSIGGSAKALGGFAVFAAGVTGVIVILNGILGAIDELTGGKFGELLAKGGEVLGGIIGGFVSGIMSAFKTEGSSDRGTIVDSFESLLTQLDGVAGHLSSTFDLFQPFFDKVSGLGEGVTTGIKTLVESALLMTGTGILEDLSRYFTTDNKGGLQAFADAMIAFAPSLNTLGEACAEISGDAGGNISLLEGPMTTLGSVAKSLIMTDLFAFVDQIMDSLTESDVLTEFIDDLAALPTHLNDLASAGSEIGDTSAIANFNSPLNALGSLVGDMLKIGFGEWLVSLADQWTGNASNLISFTDDLIELAPKLKTLSAEAVSGIDPAAITTFSSAMSAVGTMTGSVLKITWGEFLANIADWLNGKDNLGTFIDNLVDIAPKLTALSGSASDLDDGAVTAVSNVASILSALGEAAGKMPKEGGFVQKIFGEVDPKEFGSSMVHLGFGLKQYAKAVKAVDDMGVTSDSDPTIIIEKLAELENGLTEHGGFAQWFGGEKDIGVFGQRVAELGGQLSSFSTDIEGLKFDNIDSVITALGQLNTIANTSTFNDPKAAFANVETLLGLMSESFSTGGFLPTLYSIGEQMMQGISSGFSSPEGFDAGALAEDLGGSLKGALESYYSSFSTIGKHLATGLAAGIRLGKSAVVSAAAAVMSAALAAARAAGQIKSPSRVTQEYGRYLDEGLALGLNKYSSVAEIAAEGVMDSTLSSIGSTIGKISTAIQNGIDTTPVITPVLDLSNLSSGFGVVNGMFGQVALAERSTFGGLSRLSFAAGGNADVVAAIYDLNNRLDYVTEAITNMKVVTDTGALVGQISSQMDKALGAREVQKRRLG